MTFGNRKIPKHLIIHDRYSTKKTQGLVWMILAGIVLATSMIASFRANAEKSDLRYEAKSGQLLFQNGVGHYDPSLHLSSMAQVQINGLTAHVTLTQTFKNQTDQWQEGIYVFPLPENAAVNHMEMRIGERIIIGEIKEKQEAKRIYQAAKKSGKRAALTEQNRPNMFTQKVANIEPQQSVGISISYFHPVTYTAGEFSWRFPMTITPRYIPGAPTQTPAPQYDDKFMSAQTDDNEQAHFENAVVDTSKKKYGDFDARFAIDATPVQQTPAALTEGTWLGTGWGRPTLSVPDAAAITPFMYAPALSEIFNPIEISIELNSGLPLSHIGALYHDIAINKVGDSHLISLTDGRVNMDRDFVLQWRPIESAAPLAAVFSERVNDEMYSLVMLVPPHKQSARQGLARDMVFVIDTSGSMQGISITQAKASLNLALSRLGPEDNFNIIEFNSHFSTLFSELNTASPGNIQYAMNWVSHLKAGGGTEMHSALTKAFSQFEKERALQQTIFITDGAVGNEKKLFHVIKDCLNNSRLFTVGIGSAPNSFFMKKAAEFGRGSFTYIGDVDRVSEKMHALFEKLESAVVSDIAIQWPDTAVIYPQKIPDLYLSEPLLISAKSGDLEGDIVITGNTASSSWQQRITLDNHRPNKGIATVWARAKIEDLEDQKISGRNASEVKKEITEVALTHKLLSAYTSFVAVEHVTERAAEEALHSQNIPNVLVFGKTADPAITLTAVQYPKTATSAEVTWWLGLFCLLLMIIFVRMGND